MTCQEAVELMQRDLDHDLNDSERQHMLTHMSRCLECADVYSRLQQLSLDLANIPKVLPPYSLVDSILPRLDELDRLRLQGETAGQLNAAGQQDSVVLPLQGKSWFRRMRQTFPMSAVGGVVAAGIILTLFIMNQDQVLQQKNHDRVLMNQELASSSGNQSEKMKVANNNSQTASEANRDGSENKMEIAQATEAPVSKADIDQEIASALPEKTPTANQLRSVEPLSAAGSTDSFINKPSSSGFTQEAQNNPSLPQSDLSTGDTNQPTAGDRNSSANDATEVAKTGDAPNVTTNPSFKAPTDSGITELPGATYGDEGSLKSSQSLPDNKGTLMMPGPTPEVPFSGDTLPSGSLAGGTMMGVEIEENRLESPDKLYVAIYNAATKRVTIVKASDETQVVFTSAIIWTDEDHITWNEWRSNTQVAYTITQGVVRKSHVIDLTIPQESVEANNDSSNVSK